MRITVGQKRIGVVLIIAIVVGLVCWWAVVGRSDPSWVGPAAYDRHPAQHARGGTVRMAVTTPPEMTDAGTGGDALRQLVLPSLFVARPDGSWTPSIVEPGSDHTKRNAMSASFRLRDSAKWSDGSSIGVDDLRRTMNPKLVRKVSEPDASGRITVDFLHKLVNWRALWSDTSAISSSKPGVDGGPFHVESVVSGLQTVVVRNDNWHGPGPFIDRIDLVLAADTTTERHLLASKQVDVTTPDIDSKRIETYKGIDGVDVQTDSRGGPWYGLQANLDRVPEVERVGVLASMPRKEFVDAFLLGDAHVIDGLVGANDSTWSKVPKSNADLTAVGTNVVLPATLPLSPFLGAALTRPVIDMGGKFDVQLSSVSDLESAKDSGRYGFVLRRFPDALPPCFQCEWGSIDPDAAAAADTGSQDGARTFEAELRDQGVLLPLWRQTTVIASRPEVVRGMQADGYSSSQTWNAEAWWKP